MAAGGGGLPPEFAAFFGNGGPRRGRRRQHHMSPDDIFGGFGRGGNIHMSFSSFGPGGGIHFTNLGGGHRRNQYGDPRDQQVNQGYERTGNPVIDITNGCNYWCNYLCRNCFTILILWNMFGGLVPGFIYDYASKLFMKESDPRLYDISYVERPNYENSMNTPTLNINYFFTDSAKI